MLATLRARKARQRSRGSRLMLDTAVLLMGRGLSSTLAHGLWLYRVSGDNGNLRTVSVYSRKDTGVERTHGRDNFNNVGIRGMVIARSGDRTECFGEKWEPD